MIRKMRRKSRQERQKELKRLRNQYKRGKLTLDELKAAVSSLINR